MVAAIRLARERIGLPIIVPALISWTFLFGYQWAFSLSYHGSQATVFSYYSGIIGDGILIPAANLGAYMVLRQLWPNVSWQRPPLYVATTSHGGATWPGGSRLALCPLPRRRRRTLLALARKGVTLRAPAPY